MLWSISETVKARAFKPLPLCSAPLKTKLTSRDYWNSRNTRKPLSKLKHVLRKYCRVSQKQWMLELSNLCHCVQHPWKLTSRDFWSWCQIYPPATCQMKWQRWHPLDPLTPPNGHTYWFPRGEWPTWSKSGKWHKWAMQLFINMWHYLQWLFTNMYMHHLITYSCMKSIKMLWGLFLPWPIYSYPSINNLVYYYTKVLLSFICNCHHFATDHLHDYIHFTIYHLVFHCLQLSLVFKSMYSVCDRPSLVFIHFCDDLSISTISLKICTPKLQLLHNTEWTKKSGHGKIIDHPGELLHMKDLSPRRVTI